MKNVKTICLVLGTVITLSSCKQKQPHLTYQHADKEYTVKCGEKDMKLFKEALFTFQDDIVKHYNKTGKDAYRSYRSFINEAIYDRAQVKDMISAHTMDVFTALKAQPGLWNGTSLNYNNDLMTCIGENIRNNDLKVTFNALISTNSMKPKLFGSPLRSQTRELTKDNYLATFVALDLYYSKLFGLDYAQLMADKKAKEEAKKKEEEELKKNPPKEEEHDHKHKPGEEHY